MTTAADFWTLGDYSRIAELIAAMGPALVQAAGVGPGHRVLDVGAGTGNATLPAAAAGCAGDRHRHRARADGRRRAGRAGARPPVTWQVADAQALPFPDAAFDVVLSVVGAMFAPDHEATARELLRVCRPGGTIAMANWTPGGEVGRFFAILARYGPTGPGPAPTAWGDPAHRHPPARARDRHHVALARPAGLRRAACRARRLLPRPLPAAGDVRAPTRELDAELIDLYSGGYDLEYLTVLAVTRPTGAPRGAPTGRSG